MAGAARAGEEKSETPAAPPATKPYGFRALGRDSRYLFTRPAKLDRKGWTRVGLTLSAAGGLFALRREIQDEVREHPSESRSRVLDGARGVMGGPGLAAGLALVSWSASFATHDDREKETAQLLLTSLGYSALVAAAGQYVLSSQRPREGNEVHFFRAGGHGISGDAAIAASIVAPLRRQYLRVRPGDGALRRVLKRAGTGLLYAGAVLTAAQRVNSDAHWAPDAFLGLATGLTVGETICDAHEGARDRQVSFSVSPMSRGGTVALFRFVPERRPRGHLPF